MDPLIDLLTGAGTGLARGIDRGMNSLWGILPAITYAKNSQWAKPPPPGGSYHTSLSPAEEAQFQGWVAANKVPFDPSPTADYDMRGFFKALMSNDPKAQSAINPNDKQIHYPDYWKTPYHESFSSESQWAMPNAPSWNDQDQLVTPDGRIVFDERAQRGP